MGISERDQEVFFWGGATKCFFCRLIYESPPPPYHYRLQQRAGAPHHASRASRKRRTRLCCRTPSRKDGPSSTVSGAVFLPVVSAFACVSAAVADVHARLCVLHLKEDHNNPDTFKQSVFSGWRAARRRLNFPELSSVSLTC